MSFYNPAPGDTKAVKELKQEIKAFKEAWDGPDSKEYCGQCHTELKHDGDFPFPPIWTIEMEDYERFGWPGVPADQHYFCNWACVAKYAAAQARKIPRQKKIKRKKSTKKHKGESNVNIKRARYE